MKVSEKIWWYKLGSAIIVAILTFIVQVFFNVNGSTVFMIGVIFYIGISEVLSSMNGVEKLRGLKIGIGVFLFSWIMIWVLLFTVWQSIG